MSYLRQCRWVSCHPSAHSTDHLDLTVPQLHAERVPVDAEEVGGPKLVTRCGGQDGPQQGGLDIGQHEDYERAEQDFLAGKLKP